MPSIKDADLIVVLNEGVIIEQGSHQQLYELDGFYKKMISMQASHD